MTSETDTIDVGLTIKPEHVDIYGHLTNTRFPKYFEEGMLELQKQMGVSPEALIERGVGLFVYRATYTYKKQVDGGEQVTVQSRWVPYDRGPLIKTKHRMISERGLLAAADLEHAFFDFKERKLITGAPDWFVQKVYDA